MAKKLYFSMPAADPMDQQNIERMVMPLAPDMPIIAKQAIWPQNTFAHFDMHYALELGIVMSGRMKRYYKNWTTDLLPGQIWLCGIWESHGYDILKSPSAGIIFAVLPEMLAQIQFPEAPHFNWLAPFIAPPRKRPAAGAAAREDMLLFGRRIAVLLETRGTLAKVALRLALLEILTTLCADWHPPDSLNISATDQFSSISRAIQLIFRSHELITITVAAKACGMQPQLFSRLFQCVMGISFTDFSLRHRLNGAKEQMLVSREPIKAIASAWGFTDKSHFHHVFVSHYGCTPSECRKRYVKV